MFASYELFILSIGCARLAGAKQACAFVPSYRAKHSHHQYLGVRFENLFLPTIV
jgi:hypothetical protein